MTGNEWQIKYEIAYRNSSSKYQRILQLEIPPFVFSFYQQSNGNRFVYGQTQYGKSYYTMLQGHCAAVP